MSEYSIKINKYYGGENISFMIIKALKESPKDFKWIIPHRLISAGFGYSF